jgi:formylmethanofuran dehydrogenase subunit B
VRRQQERDVAVLLPTIQHLTERQYQLFFLFQTVIARHKPDGFARLVDDDVAEAAASMAATLETAARGVIYEHGTQSPVAQRLATEMKALLGELREQGAKVYDGETAIVLRAIEQGAREARTKVEGDAIAYLSLMARLVQHSTTRPSEPAAASGRGSSLILP